MAKIYERYMRVLQRWPVDRERASKGLAEYIREQGKATFNKKGDFEGNTQQCEKRLESLERLSKDHWLTKYPRTRRSSALGLSAEQCRFGLTRDFQNTSETSRFSAFVDVIKDAFSSSSKQKKAE